MADSGYEDLAVCGLEGAQCKSPPLPLQDDSGPGQEGNITRDNKNKLMNMSRERERAPHSLQHQVLRQQDRHRRGRSADRVCSTSPLAGLPAWVSSVHQWRLEGQMGTSNIGTQ